MIERVYMGIDGRRDHSFRIPRPDLSVKLESPNACTDCHDDRGADWAAEKVASWFPDSTRPGEHIATAFAAARKGDAGPETLSLLVQTASNQGLPAFIRASALETLKRYTSVEVAEQTKALLNDEEPLVRVTAIPLQWQASPELRLKRLTPLLDDPIKAVRIEAVRGLLDLLGSDRVGRSAASAQSAFLEYWQALAAKADFPESQMAMAGTALTLRQFGNAERAFAEAARLDPQLVDAWIMIARLRSAQGDGNGAIEALRAGLAFNPGSVQLAQLLQDLGGSIGVE